MTYGILLWPHGNVRYQDALQPLAMAELRLVLGDALVVGVPEYRSIAGTQFLCFDSTQPEDQLARRLARLAHLQMLFALNADGSLRPLCSRAQAYLGWDLSGILKYKGKTNEVFTRFLLNLALCSSAFSDKPDAHLTVFDPMCGRGTTLFEAVNRGYSAVGADIDRADIHEANMFFKRYLEYHKIKHQAKDMSMTLSGKKPVARKLYRFADTLEAFKADECVELSLLQADAVDAILAFPQKSFHLAVCDLPYGVQHASAAQGRPESIERLLARMLPPLKTRLKPGGAVALSFNVNTLPKSRLVSALESAGYEVMRGEAYDHLAHWVEQAVTRDAVVAR